MDAMALLCTLHAEGPATLRKLRESGYRSLADVQSAEADAIGQIMDISAAAARRFLREADALAQRVEEEEPSEFGAGLATDASVGHEELSLLSQRDRNLVDRVLTRWREEESEETQPVTDVTPHRSVQTLLAGSIDGLTQEQCDALARCEIDSLAALASAEAMDLAQQSGLGFSTIRRLQFLAARARNTEERESRLSAAERPEVDVPQGAVRAWELAPTEAPATGTIESHPQESAGGPFADL